MPTVKEIKAELDEAGIDYPVDALKADLEKLLPLTATEVIENRAGTIAEQPEDIVDPNAHPDTQAK